MLSPREKCMAKTKAQYDQWGEYMTQIGFNLVSWGQDETALSN